jgi:hypothetical protein
MNEPQIKLKHKTGHFLKTKLLELIDKIYRDVQEFNIATKDIFLCSPSSDLKSIPLVKVIPTKFFDYWLAQKRRVDYYRDCFAQSV